MLKGLSEPDLVFNAGVVRAHDLIHLLYILVVIVSSVILVLLELSQQVGLILLI